MPRKKKKSPSSSKEQVRTLSGLALIDLQYALCTHKPALRTHSVRGGGDVAAIGPERTESTLSHHAHLSAADRFTFAALA